MTARSLYCRAAVAILLVSGFLSMPCNGAPATITQKFGVVPTEFSHPFLLELRGGAKRKKKSRTGSLAKTVTGKTKVGAKKASEKKASSGNGLSNWYAGIPRLTKIYVNSILFCTALGLILGEERAQSVMALDPMRLMYGFEFWRPITAASFLGELSISWLMSGWYLCEYGSSLEKAYGSAEYFLFLVTQIGLLTMFASVLRIPFFTQSVITGMLHVLSRAMPHQKVKWMVITVPYWTLPYGLMVSDCLQAKSPAAAMPHILGILVGHFYHFNRFIWPKTGGEDWLRAPDFLVGYFDPDSVSRSAAKESIKKALQKRKKGKGKKLGSAA